MAEIAVDRVKTMFPNEDMSRYKTRLRDEVRVILSPLPEPGDITVIGGIEVVIDPETGRILQIYGG